MRLGVYGGSFDPPHIAHVLAAAYALSIGQLDRLLIVPVFSHAFNKPLTQFEHRFAMCELAFASLARCEISRIECSLPTPNRTLNMLEAVARDHPGAKLRLVVGTDVMAESSKWHAFDAISQLAPPLVVGRNEHPSGRSYFQLPDVSSSQIRSLIAAKSSAETEAELAALLPGAVLHHIREHRLYLA